MSNAFHVGQQVRFRGHIATVVTVKATSVDVEYGGTLERITPSGYKRLKEVN